jgi:hypothetical protein
MIDPFRALPFVVVLLLFIPVAAIVAIIGVVFV